MAKSGLFSGQQDPNGLNRWSKWDGPTLNAMSNDVAIESLTIACKKQVQA
jgi:hypothetical protein